MTHPQSSALTAEQIERLRDMWKAAGGKFHGPNVETGTMPESQLLPFLHSLADQTEAMRDAERLDWVEANVSAIRDIGWIRGPLRPAIDAARALSPERK